jgi:hypothetical protein
VKKALVAAGLEIYRTQGDEIQVAERVRLHLMDSGVRVQVGDAITVSFTARSQKSDFPNVNPQHLFQKVRDAIGAGALGRGYTESRAHTVEVKDRVDASKVLDVWHEVTYARETAEPELVDEVRWALEVEKYVGHRPSTP